MLDPRLLLVVCSALLGGALQDDSYFDAMVAATMHEEDNTSQAGSRAVSVDRGYALNDDEYYRGMMELGTTSSSDACHRQWIVCYMCWRCD